MDKKASIIKDQMNEWGKNCKAFVFLIDFECESPQLWPLEAINTGFHFNFNGTSNSWVKTNSRAELYLQKFPENFETYQSKFLKVKEHIMKGDSFLINLTCATPIESPQNLEVFYHSIHSKYKCWLENEFVCFSPESFIRIKNQEIYAYPMKGTINASIPNAKKIILADQKEAAEHATIVDLLRNDLSKVATEVTVSKYRYYEEIKTQEKTIGQISSEIKGTLDACYHEKMGDIIFELLPAGSVTGAPKHKTVEIIRSVEGMKRGYYCGVAGYFDGQNLDSCVLIRFLQENKIYRSGGGITFQSDVKDEYQEMIDKIYVPVY